MAKVISLQGKARGKIGSIVYRVEAGIGMIASEYNPSPRNPRTIAQVEQRSKMNLAGRLSKIISYEDIAALGASPRQARQKFMSNLLKSIRSTTTAGTTTGGGSMIRWNELKFSDGRSYPADITANIAEGTAKLNASVEFSSTDTTIQGVHFVAVFGDSKKWLGVRSFEIARHRQATVEIDFSDFVETPEDLAVAVYAIPILLGDEAVSTIYGAVLSGTDSADYSVYWLRELAQRNALGATQYVLSKMPE